MAKVAVLMGSPNDRSKMQPAVDTLEAFGIEADVRVLSAHRTPAAVAELASGAREAGYSAFICGAGMAAQAGNASAAAATAASRSDSSQAGTSPTTSSGRIGLRFSYVSPERAPRHSPPT